MESEVSDMLNAHINELRQSRRADKLSLDGLDSKIKIAIAQIGRRPRETLEQLEASARALEHTHNTTAQSNSDERQFMRNLDDIRKKKKELSEFESKQIALTALKNERSLISDRLRQADKNLDELYVSQRRARAAAKVGLAIADLDEKTISVPEHCRPYVIGKGGSSIRGIESQCDISIDVDRTGGRITLTGGASGIAEAEAQIAIIVDTETVELELSHAVLSVLMHNKAALAQAIQKRHNVRMDISRANQSCKISGLSESLAAARREIDELDCDCQRISVDASVIPVVIGKGGTNIQKVQTDFDVQLNVDKSALMVEVTGASSNVAKAAAFLKSFAEDSREVEVSLVVERAIMSATIAGVGGRNIRELQESCPGAYLSIVRPPSETDGDKKDEKRTRPSAEQTLMIKGRASAVEQARLKVQALIDGHHMATTLVLVTDAVRSALLTKAGAAIKEIRQKFPSATIELVESGEVSVAVHCTDAAVRTSAVAAIEEVVKAHQTRSVQLSRDVTVGLKSAVGKNTRAALNEAGVTFEIDSDKEMVFLCGPTAALVAAEEALVLLASQMLSVEMDVSEDDFVALMEGGDKSFAKVCAAAHAVEIVPLRKAGIVKLRGSREALAAAEADVLIYLSSGDTALSSTRTFPISESCIAGFIGKGGANIKKLQQEGEDGSKISLDILRGKGLVRVRAGTAAAADAAVQQALKILDGVKVSTSVKIAFESHVQAFEVASQAADIFCIEAVADSNGREVVLRGTEGLVSTAAAYIQQQCSGRASAVVPIPESLMKTLTVDGSPPLQGLPFLERLPPGCTVVATFSAQKREKAGLLIECATADLEAGKLEVYRMLTLHFPRNFACVPMDRTCLAFIDVPSERQRIAAVCGGETDGHSSRSEGVVVQLEPELSCVRIGGDDEVAVAIATEELRKLRLAFSSSYARVAFEKWMLPALVGTRGAGIEALQKEANANLRIDRTASAVVISLSPRGGKKDKKDKDKKDKKDKKAVETDNQRDALERAKKIVEDRVAFLAATTWTIKLDSDDVCQRLIGKAGATIKKIRSDSGASLNMDAKTRELVVTAPTSESLGKARAAVRMVLEAHEATNFSEVRSVDQSSVPLIIGKGGANAKDIQTAHKVKLDIDRSRGPARITVRGAKQGCMDAIKAIDDLLKQADMPLLADPVSAEAAAVAAAAAAATATATAAAAATENAHEHQPTAPSVSRTNYHALSSSAQRRIRRKEREMAARLMKAQEENEEEEEEEEEEDDDDDGTDVERSFEISTGVEAPQTFQMPTARNIGVIGVQKPQLVDLDPEVEIESVSESGSQGADDGGDNFFISKSLKGLRIRL